MSTSTSKLKSTLENIIAESKSKSTLENIIAALFIIVYFGVVLPYAPFILIWALNTLFGLGIAYTFKTWLAVNAVVFVMNLNALGKK